GERIDARCAVLEAATGSPALDKKGNPLTDSVDFVITYEDTDAFAKDSEGQMIAARAGMAAGRCSGPSPRRVDPHPPGTRTTHAQSTSRSSPARRPAWSPSSQARSRWQPSRSVRPAWRSTRSTTP